VAAEIDGDALAPITSPSPWQPSRSRVRTRLRVTTLPQPIGLACAVEASTVTLATSARTTPTDHMT
jgi:hypothetical protein